jgi:tetratricopeptide (TPR) repeat protein
MGKELVKKILPVLDKMKWPQAAEFTEKARRAYEIGLDEVDSYKGDPKTLAAALRTFQTADSRPFAFAGVAYTLLAAAREGDGAYDQESLDTAMVWLERAQELMPNEVDINMIEALIYVYSGRFDDARLILDYLQEEELNSYYLQTAEIAYWWSQRDIEETAHWVEQAIAMARTVPQRLRLRARLADYYMELGMTEEALTLYKEAIHFDPDNAELNHKISLIYWNQENYEEAERYNKKALQLANLPEARELANALNRRQGGTGVLKRLFGG